MTGRQRLGILGVVVSASVWGCAAKPLYDWQRYDESLQASQIRHDESQARADMESSINGIQKTGGKAPPGLFAEYGFQLFRRGDHQGAIEYFKREAQLFPESKYLMDTLIARIQEKEAAPAAKVEGGK